MRRYYFLIRLFVLSHMIFTIACNGNNGSDVDNESIQILYEDQNEEAIKTATAIIDFAEAYEDGFDTLNSLDPDDPNASEVMENIVATLETLADAMEASTSNLISLEEQIQNELENGDVQAQIDPVITGGTLILLGVIGVYVASETAFVKEMNKCFKRDFELTAHLIGCLVESWTPGFKNATRDSGKVVVVSVATYPVHGTVGLTLKACKVKQTGDKISTFIGVGEEFVRHTENQDKHKIQYNVPINSVTDAPEDDISLVPIYIAQSDGSDDDIFPLIPEGEWSMVAFAPDYEREFIPSVKVSANQTTEVTIDITPIEGCGTTTTVTGGDEDNIPDLSYNHCGIQVEVHGYKHSVAPDYTRDYDGDVTIHSWEKYPGSFSGNTFTGNYSRSYGSSLIITGTITATLDTSATMITSINWTEHHLSDGNTSDDSFSGTNIPLDYSTDGSVVFQIKGEETCDHISSLSSNINGGADGLNESLENYECNYDSKIYVSFSTE